MKLLPAIDLIGGRCVRLAQGDFERETSYSDDPTEALADFARGGADEAHLVDLDGARAGEPRQHDLLARLARATGLTLQVAGALAGLFADDDRSEQTGVMLPDLVHVRVVHERSRSRRREARLE